MPLLSELSSLLSDFSLFPLKLLFSLTARFFTGAAIFCYLYSTPSAFPAVIRGTYHETDKSRSVLLGNLRLVTSVMVQIPVIMLCCKWRRECKSNEYAEMVFIVMCIGVWGVREVQNFSCIHVRLKTTWMKVRYVFSHFLWLLIVINY